MSESTLLKNMSWLTLVSGVERLAAVLQTVLIARALGITEYGVYGLIFGTIGLAASITGLQMGLTATVYIARYKDTEKSKAAFVITFVNRFAIAVAALFLLCTIPFANSIGILLIGRPGSEIAIIAGCLLVAFSVLSGVQDGIIQGFEDFRSAALARLVTSAITLACIYPASVEFGLLGAMAVVLLGILVKYLWLVRRIGWHRLKCRLPGRGEGLRGRDLLWGFSFPSMLVSLLVGAIGWLGTFVLSRQPNGFEALAIVNTGLQWRGPIFLLTSAISSVAVPAISRYYQGANHSAIKGLHRKSLLFNGAFALVVSIALILLAPLILPLYGPEFAHGALVFSLVIVSTIPQVITGVYMQQLVAKGGMWEILFLHVWLVAPMAIGYLAMIPRFDAVGFAVTNLIAWSFFSFALALTRKAN